MVVTALIVAGCEDTMIYHNDETSKIIGTWEWVSSTGGIAGVIHTPITTGDSIQVVFTASGVYQRIVNGVTEIDAPYSIEKGSTIYSTEMGDIMHYTGETIVNSLVTSSDTLLLREECFDCFIHTYVKRTGTAD